MCLELRCRVATALSHRRGSRGEGKRLKVKSSYTNQIFIITETLPFSAYAWKPREWVEGCFLAFSRLGAT